MTTRRSRWRRLFLPLVALASLAIFAWGVVDWWKFHRDLFVEEEQALVELAEQTGTLRYRRAGAVRWKRIDARGAGELEPTPVPWSVPFVGRVESIDASADVEPQSALRWLQPGIYPQDYALGAYAPPAMRAPRAMRASAMLPNGQVVAVPAPPNASGVAPALPRMAGPVTTAPRTTPLARDPALRLPGLKEFRDLPPAAIDAQAIDLSDLSLTLSKPSFPTSFLHPQHLEEPFPSGEALGDAERESLAADIADAWRAEAAKSRSQAEPRLIYVHRQTIDLSVRQMERSTSIFLRDGARRFDFAGLPHELDASPRRPGNVRISTEMGDWEFFVDRTRKYPLARRLPLDEAVPDEQELDEAPDQAHRLPPPFDPYGHMASLPRDPLGDDGERVVAIERVDRDRLRIEARSSEVDSPGDEQFWRFRAIVRTDLGHAIEQFDWYLRSVETPVETGTPKELIYREIRWLSRRKGRTVVTERLSDPWPIGAEMATEATPPGTIAPGNPTENPPASGSLADSPPPVRLARRSLIAITYDPIFPKEIFDPAMYGGKTWPEPRRLPAFRPYQVWLAAGAAGLGFVGLFAFLRTVFGRRRDPAADGRRSLFALRFGMITALAFALFAISAAGWTKVRVDEARDQQALIAELARLDEGFRFERGDAEFPWMFVSTEEFPIGAPLTEVELGPRPSPELLDRLFQSSPELRLTVREIGREPVADRDELASQAFGQELPAFESFEWGVRRFEPIERGTPLTEEESDEALTQMLAAWTAAKQNRPTRYVLRQRSRVAAIREGIAVRDGERNWSIDFGGPHPPRIDVSDGRVRRRFLRTDGDWLLVDRRPAMEDRLPFDTIENLPFAEAKTVVREDDYLSSQIAYGAAPERPQEKVKSVASTEELLLPSPPFVLPPEVETYYSLYERLENDPSIRTSFERLAADDLRVELTWGTPGGIGPYSQWILLVRPDLDWCVEKCDVDESYERDVSRAEEDYLKRNDPGSLRYTIRSGKTAALGMYRRRIHSRQALARREGHVVLLETRLAGRETLVDGPFFPDYETIRYAVDLDPSIDPRRFDRATLDSSDPPRRVEPWLPWHRATFFVGLGLLGYAGVRRTIDVWLARRTKRSKSGSNEPNEATADELPPSDETAS